MMNSTCETARLDLGLPSPGFKVQVVSNGQSVKATCAAMVATHYWALQRRAANTNGKMSADGYVVEVWHV